MQGEQQIFGSSSVEWGTPPYLFDALDRIFHFDLDPASTDENAKTPRHYTAVDNGLVQPWDCEAFFVNPPYRRGKQGAGGWLAKGIETIQTYHNVGVYLLPVRTGTQWWVNHMYKAHEWWFIQGRVPFIGMAPADEEETEDGDDLLAELDVDPPSQEIVAKPKKRKIMPAPFDSVVAIFRYPLLRLIPQALQTKQLRLEILDCELIHNCSLLLHLDHFQCISLQADRFFDNLQLAVERKQIIIG